MSALDRRVERLEAFHRGSEMGRPFLWGQGQSLADALAGQRLTLDDGPLYPIRLIGVKPGAAEPEPDPDYERDRHLLVGKTVIAGATLLARPSRFGELGHS